MLALVTAAALDRAVDDARERSAAVVLDARLDPRTKLDLVGPITGPLDPEDPRGSLDKALDDTARSEAATTISMHLRRHG